MGGSMSIKIHVDHMLTTGPDCLDLMWAEALHFAIGHGGLGESTAREEKVGIWCVQGVGVCEGIGVYEVLVYLMCMRVHNTIHKCTIHNTQDEYSIQYNTHDTSQAPPSLFTLPLPMHPPSLFTPPPFPHKHTGIC